MFRSSFSFHHQVQCSAVSNVRDDRNPMDDGLCAVRLVYSDFGRSSAVKTFSFFFFKFGLKIHSHTSVSTGNIDIPKSSE